LPEERRVLITGGTGFIGSRLALRCLSTGYAVRVLGQENTDAESANRKRIEKEGAEVLLGSVTDAHRLPEILEGIDVVYHLAAAQHEVNIPDQRFREINVQGTVNLFEAGARAGVNRIVHGSTIGVYGEAMDGLIDEQTPPRPDNIYGRSKLEGEAAALSFKERIPVSVVRIPETYGPGDRRLLKLYRAIRKGVFVMIGQGKNLHHPIYIDDLIDALFLVAEKPEAEGEVFVVAGAGPVSTDEMVAAIAAALGARPPRVRVPLSPFLLAAAAMEKAFQPFGMKPPLHRRRMDFFRKSFAFSLEKAKARIGFRPKTSFREGAARTADWYAGENLL